MEWGRGKEGRGGGYERPVTMGVWKAVNHIPVWNGIYHAAHRRIYQRSFSSRFSHVLSQAVYCMAKRSCPILYRNFAYRMGQDFLDHIVVQLKNYYVPKL